MCIPNYLVVCQEWQVRHTQLEEKYKSMLQSAGSAASADASKANAGTGTDPDVHVMIVTIHQDDKECNVHSSRDKTDADCIPLHGAEQLNDPDEMLEVIHESKPLEDKSASHENEPVTPPQILPRSSSLDINAPEFVRPIPLNVSWADLVEDDTQWYEESDGNDTPLEKSPESDAHESAEAGAGWLSKKNQGEFRSFRAFSHYRTASFGKCKCLCLKGNL